MTITAYRLTADEMSKGMEFIPEGKALVEGGDIKIDSYRLVFQKAVGRPTTLADDAILTIVGLDSEGDYTPMIECGTHGDEEIEWLVSRMLGLEQTTTSATTTTTNVTGSKIGPLVVVQENIAGFDYGDELKDQSDITRYLRLVFNIAQQASDSPEWKYADDVIADIIRRTPRVPNIDDEEYETAIIDAMGEFDPQQLPDLSVQDRINVEAKDHEARILAVANYFNSRPAFIELLGKIDTSNKVVMMSSIDCYFQIRDMMSDKDKPLDFWGLVAEPGTTPADVLEENTRRAKTNEPQLPYDKYVKFVGGKRKTFSEIDQIALMLTPIATAKNKAGTHSENVKKKQFEALARADLATENSTVTVLKRAFREACSVMHHIKKYDRFDAWSRKDDGTLLLDKDNNPVKLGVLRVAVHVDNETRTRRTTPKPIHIWESDKPTQTGSYSVREFIKFRPNMVPVSAGLETLLKDYKDSVAEARAGETPEGEPLPKNDEELLTKINYFANVVLEPRLWKWIAENISKKEHEEMFSSVVTIFDRLNLILESKKASAPRQQNDKLTEGADKKTGTK